MRPGHSQCAARLLLLVAALAAACAPRAARADGVPLDGDPTQLRYSGPNPCVRGGEALDTVQVSDPQSCNQYFVCCAGRPVHYACRVPSTPYPYTIYSDATATNSYYAPTTGRCTRSAKLSPTTAAAGNGTRAAATAGAPQFQRVSATRPFNPLATAFRQPPLEGGPEITGAWELITGPDSTSNTGIVGMHAALVPRSDKAPLVPRSDKVVLWARRLPEGVAYPPGMSPDGVGEVSSVYDTNTGVYTVAPMRLAPFCTGQSHAADGTIIAAGGDADAGGYLEDGLRAIRLWRPDATAWEVVPTPLAEPHWYPTQLQLGDGVRTLIVGGYTSGESGASSPSIEVFNYATNEVITLFEVPALLALGGLNLYPIVTHLPWTPADLPGSYTILLFSGNQGQGSNTIPLFSGNQGQVMFVSPDSQVMFVSPDSQVMFVSPDSQVNTLAPALPPWPTPGFSGAFSAAGGHTLLMLEPENGYAPEFAMFGGTAFTGGACVCDVPANDQAYRMKLDQEAVIGATLAWEVETMPGPRVMVDATILPNGQVVLVNGARVVLVNGARSGNSNGGGPGGGGQARGAETHAWLYDPKAPAGARFSVLAASPIERFYHSAALLLPSGDLLVVGSEQNDCFEACFQFNPAVHQFQAEVFKLPYAFSPGRPAIAGAPPEVAAMGGEITVAYEGEVTGATLMAPGAVTHQLNMQQRAIKLAVTANGGGAVTLAMPPPGGLVAQPGMYMLFLLNGDVPCTKAAWLQLTL
ncbi:MAG: hypothetical protein J3K34DRAFT_525211 [Monoraphidium minutum]|nr:MAG: hypothetical protein J3K34DRAFT_525211 [Monoraphidium minutum]